MTKHPQHGLGFSLNNVLPNISSAPIGGQTNVQTRAPTNSRAAFIVSQSVPSCRPRANTSPWFQLQSPAWARSAGWNSQGKLKGWRCIQGAFYLIFNVYLPLYITSSVPSLDALFIHFESFFVSNRLPCCTVLGPVPFPRFHPFPYHLARVEWLKSTPTKWDTPSRTTYVSSSLYFNRRAVLSCCHVACVGCRRPFVVCHDMEPENNIEIWKKRKKNARLS